MNDRDIMENLLLTTKGVCDLFMHGAIESSTDNVHQTFCTALGNSLSMQDSIYKEMSSHGLVFLRAGPAAAYRSGKAEVFRTAGIS